MNQILNLWFFGMLTFMVLILLVQLSKKTVVDALIPKLFVNEINGVFFRGCLCHYHQGLM